VKIQNRLHILKLSRYTSKLGKQDLYFRITR